MTNLTQPRWKTISINFLAVFPLLQILTRYVAPFLGWMPALLKDALLVVIMCIDLSFILPILNRFFARFNRPTPPQ